MRPYWNLFIGFFLGLLVLMTAVLAVDYLRESLVTKPVSPNVVLQQVQSKTIDYSSGQKIYVPAYSSIPLKDKTELNLTILLSIRNTDPTHAITLTRIDYYDTKGSLVKEFIQESVMVNALETKEFMIAQDDKIGGSGANFFIQWNASEDVYAPIVEALMYGKNDSRNHEFKSVGILISE